MIRDNGLFSGLVVCLVLPSMASIWWSHCMEPSLRAITDQPSARLQINGDLNTSTPAIPSRRKIHPPQPPVADVRLVGQAGAPETNSTVLVQRTDQSEAGIEWIAPWVAIQNEAGNEVEEEAVVLPTD